MAALASQDLSMTPGSRANLLTSTGGWRCQLWAVGMAMSATDHGARAAVVDEPDDRQAVAVGAVVARGVVLGRAVSHRTEALIDNPAATAGRPPASAVDRRSVTRNGEDRT